MYLIDTNILIYAYRNLGQCRQRLDAHEDSKVHICAINIAEIEYGIAKSSRPEGLKKFLNQTQHRYALKSMNVAAAQYAGQVRSKLERIGQPIGSYDLLIAGIALAHNLTIVTRNSREFERVDGLRIENWYE